MVMRFPSLLLAVVISCSIMSGPVLAIPLERTPTDEQVELSQPLSGVAASPQLMSMTAASIAAVMLGDVWRKDLRHQIPSLQTPLEPAKRRSIKKRYYLMKLLEGMDPDVARCMAVSSLSPFSLSVGRSLLIARLSGNIEGGIESNCFIAETIHRINCFPTMARIKCISRPVSTPSCG